MIFRLDSDRFIDIGIRHVAAPQSIKLLSMVALSRAGKSDPPSSTMRGTPFKDSWYSE